MSDVDPYHVYLAHMGFACDAISNITAALGVAANRLRSDPERSHAVVMAIRWRKAARTNLAIAARAVADMEALARINTARLT